jgi:hypothetical protein
MRKPCLIKSIYNIKNLISIGNNSFLKSARINSKSRIEVYPNISNSKSGKLLSSLTKIAPSMPKICISTIKNSLTRFSPKSSREYMEVFIA